MKRSFFITLGLYLLLAGAIWKLYEPLSLPKKKTIHIADIRILKPKRCECGCQMQKPPPKKVQPKIKPKPKPKPKQKVKPKPKPIVKKSKPKPKPKSKKRRKPKKTVKKRVSKKVASKPQKNFTPTSKPSQPISVSKPQKAVSQPTSSLSKVSTETKISYQRFYIQTFLDRIEAAIRRHTHYPRIARRTHQEGVVEICFTLEPSGEVTHLHIVKSSDHKILDRAAKKTILEAAKEFPHPKKSVDLQIPIEYRLR